MRSNANARPALQRRTGTSEHGWPLTFKSIQQGEAWASAGAALLFTGIGPALAVSALLALDGASGGLVLPSLGAAALAALVWAVRSL